jgi:hypothetical protein
MKVELTREQEEEIENALESNSVRRWLKQKDNMKFEIGDVLLKYSLRTDYQTKKQSWIPENINSDNKLAQRYVYIYEDEFGIGYLKQLRVANGTLGKELYCLTDYDFSTTKFEVDPEYAEKVLLGGEFNIKEIRNASLEGRKIVTKMNRKIGKKGKTLQDFNDMFDSLKAGDIFWTTQDYTGRWTEEHQITKITKISINDLEKENDWTWRHWKHLAKECGIETPINSSYTYKIDTTGTYSKRDYMIVEFLHKVLYFAQKPAQEEKK